MDRRFVHLRAHSLHSVGEGMMRVPEIVAAARAGAGAVGLTDAVSLAGIPEFVAAAARAGVVPLPGIQVRVDVGPHRGDVALLALDDGALPGLVAVHNRARSGRGPMEPGDVALPEALLLTGGLNGPVYQAALDGGPVAAVDALRELAATFPDRLYVEVQRHGLPEEERAEAAVVAAAKALGLPLVASNEPFFADPSAAEAHDVFLCVAGDYGRDESHRPRRSAQHWFKDQDAMLELFADLPEACEATLEVLARCWRWSDCSGEALRRMRPAPLPADRLRDDAVSGLEDRLDKLRLTDAERDAYWDRLDAEMALIERTGAAQAYVLAETAVSAARRRNIPVGVGRGSVPGSLVAWALGVTDVDPVRHRLSAEQFLQPDADTRPAVRFDIDVCGERRRELDDLLPSRLGHGRVARLMAYFTLPPRAALQKTARTLGLAAMAQDVGGLRPAHADDVDGCLLLLGISDEETLRSRYGDEGCRAAALARRIARLPVGTGIHPVSLVAAASHLANALPMAPGRDGVVPTVWLEKSAVEELGVAQVGILGLSALTLAGSLCIARPSACIRFEDIPDDDPEVLAMFARGDVEDVFQFSSEGIRRVLADFRPRSFADLCFLNAAYRPGVIPTIAEYRNRRDGVSNPKPPHPLLADVLRDTHGLVVYREQIAEAVRLLTGCDRGRAADVARRLGHRKGEGALEALVRLRGEFVRDALAAGHTARDAERVFDVLERYAPYAFQRSHAVAYTLLAYRTAWLRLHRRAEWVQIKAADFLKRPENVRKLLEDPSALGFLKLCGAA